MNQDERDMDFVRAPLRDAMPPWSGSELERDLWPRMLRRIEESPGRFGLFEAALIASITASMIALPELLPVMFFHL
jgi:hypothetical protein